MNWLQKKILLLIALICFLPSVLIAQTPESKYQLSSLWEKSAAGILSGVEFVDLVGTNGAITTTFETIWPESNAYVPLAAAMSTPYCASSDNTNDAAAGTGCRTMRVSGVNTSYAAFTETLTLTGQTSVNLTTANVLFINKLQCLTTGSTFANTGTIRCGTGTNTSGVPAVVHAHMAIGFGISNNASYMVPANKTLVCQNPTAGSYDTTATASRVIQFAVDSYTDPVTAKVLQRTFLPVPLGTGMSSQAFYPGVISFPQKTAVLFQSLAAASTGPVFFRASCMLVDSATSYF